MLTWNNANTFQRCITSMTPLILDQRVKEMIILDNGSHEIALQKLLKETERNYNKIRVIYSSTNLGIAKGRKYLYSLCSGEYILSFDSDVVIANSSLFIENFLKAINLEDMWLVGGGGGNHIFFPTIFRTDINNLPSPDEPHKVTLVDEVAGWFHGFRRSMLKEFGGKIYMDDRFTPFWGEDSDFCYQIKILGGKCCILGQGNLGHAWSSCDKKENHTSLDKMWKIMIDKWYPTFGDIYKLDFDKDFYISNYPEYNEAYDPQEKYLLEGMRLGHIINQDHIKNLYDVKFINHNKLIYQKNEYHTRDFIDKYMTRDMIIVNNFKIIIDRLDKGDNAFYIYFRNLDVAIGYIKSQLIKVRNSPVVIITLPGISNKLNSLLEKYFTNYMLCEFPDYYDNIIPFMVALEATKDYKFKNFISLESESEIKSDMSVKKSKGNAYAVDLIMDWYRYQNNDYYEKEIFLNSHRLENIFNNYAYNNILELALRLPTKYSHNISPRFTPRLALRKLISILETSQPLEKSLVLYLTKIEDSEKVANNIKKLKESGNCEVLILNIGEEKFWSTSELGYDYYYIIKEDTEFIYNNYFSIFNIIHLIDFSNVILMNDNFTIDSSLEEFFHHAYNHNISFLKEETFSINLLSIKSDDLMNFGGMVSQIHKAYNEKKEGQDINLEKTIEINMMKNLALRYLWKEKKEENSEEINIEYSKLKDLFTPVDDFPLDF